MSKEDKGLFDKAKDQVSDKVDKEKVWDKVKDQGNKYFGNEDDDKDTKNRDKDSKKK